MSLETGSNNAYLNKFKGYLKGTKGWDDLDRLFDRIRAQDGTDWFIYAVGEAVPQQTSERAALLTFLDEIRTLLHREHEEDYCGIVYADDRESPTLVKIYDPNNLGVSCGFSDNPPLPGWVLSLDAPVDLEAAFPPPGNRRRWWQKLFASG
ncbi:MAG: hypothetical protein ACPG4N_06495 [Gammaproteobacteria bacterium]